MDADFGEWVESMGVASGWKLWVWLVDVAIRRYIHVNILIIILLLFLTPLVLVGSSIPTCLFILKMCFLSLYY